MFIREVTDFYPNNMNREDVFSLSRSLKSLFTPWKNRRRFCLRPRQALPLEPTFLPRIPQKGHFFSVSLLSLPLLQPWERHLAVEPDWFCLSYSSSGTNWPSFIDLFGLSLTKPCTKHQIALLTSSLNMQRSIPATLIGRMASSWVVHGILSFATEKTETSSQQEHDALQ
jgi:hypothetical protein